MMIVRRRVYRRLRLLIGECKSSELFLAVVTGRRKKLLSITSYKCSLGARDTCSNRKCI